MHKPVPTALPLEL